LSDKDFKVKNKLVLNGLTQTGPLVADSNKQVDATPYLTTLQGGTGTTTAPSSGQVLFSSGGTTYTPTTLNTLDVKGASYSADAPSSPFVGQVWIESDTDSDSFDPNIIRRKSFTATAGQTTFTTDLEFIQGYEQVFFNGMLLVRNNDYTTTNNTTVVLTTAAAVNDVVEIVTITNLNSINAATTTTNTFTGSQTFNANIGIATSPTSGKLAIRSTGDRQIDLLGQDGNVYAYIGTTGGIGSAPTNSLKIRSDAGGIVFGYQGFEQARIDTSGKFNVGTTQTLNRVNVVGGGIAAYFEPSSYPNMRGFIEHTGQSAGLRIVSQGSSLGADVSGAISFWTPSNNAANTSTDANLSERVRINGGSGGVSINSGGAIFFQNPINTGSGSIYSAGGGSLTMASYNQPMITLHEDSEIRFFIGTGTQRAVINSSGELLVGYTSDNGNFRLQVNGQIFATSSSIATSDGRYKENVSTIESGLEVIDMLRPVSFNWKEHPKHDFVTGKTVGFIAQEVQESLSDYEWIDNIIKTNVSASVMDEEGNEIYPEEEFLGIAEGNLIPLLVAAVKELKARVESLEAN
jgi:hypothetical protein